MYTGYKKSSTQFTEKPVRTLRDPDPESCTFSCNTILLDFNPLDGENLAGKYVLDNLPAVTTIPNGRTIPYRDNRKKRGIVLRVRSRARSG